MKKVLTAFAFALLLLGCARENSYDDSFVLEKLANLEKRVTELESSIQSIQSTLGSGKFVQKVQELTDSGKMLMYPQCCARQGIIACSAANGEIFVLRIH